MKGNFWYKVGKFIGSFLVGLFIALIILLFAVAFKFLLTALFI